MKTIREIKNKKKALRSGNHDRLVPGTAYRPIAAPQSRGPTMVLYLVQGLALRSPLGATISAEW